MTFKHSEPAAYTAILVHGSSFKLHRSRKEFTNGEPVMVTAAERDYLEKHAVDYHTQAYLDDEGEYPVVAVSKFTFKPAGGDL